MISETFTSSFVYTCNIGFHLEETDLFISVLGLFRQTVIDDRSYELWKPIKPGVPDNFPDSNQSETVVTKRECEVVIFIRIA